MGYDIKTENYKKNVEKLVKEWNKDMKPLIDQVDKLEGELNQLSGKKVAMALAQKQKPSLMRMRKDSPVDEQISKKLGELQDKSAELKKKMEKATQDFRRDLALLSKPEKSSMDQKTLEKLGSLVKKIVEDGIPVGKYVKIPVRDLGWDFNRNKPTSGSIAFSFEW